MKIDTSVTIEESELYPVYILCVQSPFPDDAERTTTLTADELADFKRVADEWNAWQMRLAKAINNYVEAPHQLYEAPIFCHGGRGTEFHK